MKKSYSLTFVFSVITILFAGINSMAFEGPKYSTIQKIGKVEIRNYEPFLVAETQVTGDRETSGKNGFKILAGYIFGKNKAKETITMTAPVIQKQEANNSWAIQFMMPSKYNLDTLPAPKNSRVQLKQIPARKMVALTHSGSWTESNFQEHLTILEAELKKTDLKIKGLPLWAKYNSPMTPWFLRKNEILIEVE